MNVDLSIENTTPLYHCELCSGYCEFHGGPGLVDWYRCKQCGIYSAKTRGE